MGFDTIVGQQLLKKTLQRSLQGGETGHAYLFSGPPGCGKRTMALLFAQALNCRAPDPPCQQCLSCRKSTSGNHPDIYRLVPQGNSLKIEQLREIRESLYYLPLDGRHKICIIEDAELLTLPAANSLLKILEEPPTRLVFILLSGRPWALPPTVLSRCASFMLKPLQPREVAALLESLGNIPPRKKELIIALSGGNPGQALTQAEQDPGEAYGEAQSLLKAVEHGPATGIFALAENLSARTDLSALLDIILYIYRDRLVSALAGCAGESLLESVAETGYGTKADNIMGKAYFLEKICSALLQLQSEIRSNVNRRLALEVLFLQMRGVI